MCVEGILEVLLKVCELNFFWLADRSTEWIEGGLVRY